MTEIKQSSMEKFLEFNQNRTKDHTEYYQSHLKKLDKPLKTNITKLKTEILEIERAGERNSRFDIALEHPHEE